MKKLIIIFVAIFMLPLSSLASGIDLSNMSFDELTTLREQINLAIWNSSDWQEVTVPEGIWVVGQDIPAGHWSIKVAAAHDGFYVFYFDEIDEAGKRPSRNAYVFDQEIATDDYHPFDKIFPTTVDIDMKEGWYFKCNGAVAFTPYIGKPDLGFKK